MRTWSLSLLLGCGSAEPPSSDAPPAPAPIPAAAAAPLPTSELHFAGMCDTSAVVRLADGALLVADDERNRLVRYSPEGAALGEVDLSAAFGKDEADIEAVAELGDRLYWIASHGRTRKGKDAPARRRFFATTVAAAPALAAGPIDLLPAFLAVPEAAAALAAAEPRPPKEGGINVEGLAADPATGGLLIGFRSPLSAGKALTVRLADPGAALAGSAPDVRFAAWLDLGGRGVRSLEWSAERGRWLIVAGPADDGKKPGFALYSWDGAGAPALEAEVADLRPEALALAPDGAWLLSDDGGVERGGQDCKDIRESSPADSRVFFRVRRVPLP